MTSSDKDFRFMATNDLMSELQKDNIKLDDDSERKVVRMLLKVKMAELYQRSRLENELFLSAP